MSPRQVEGVYPDTCHSLLHHRMDSSVDDNTARAWRLLLAEPSDPGHLSARRVASAWTARLLRAGTTIERATTSLKAVVQARRAVHPEAQIPSRERVLASTSKTRHGKRLATTMTGTANLALPAVHSLVATSTTALAATARSCGCQRGLWSQMCRTLDPPMRRPPKPGVGGVGPHRRVRDSRQDADDSPVVHAGDTRGLAQPGEHGIVGGTGMMPRTRTSSHFHAALRRQVGWARSGTSCRVDGRGTCTCFRLRARSPGWYRTAGDRARPAAAQCCACAHARVRRTNASDLVHEILGTRELIMSFIVGACGIYRSPTEGPR